jgi:hypothetical protein
VSPVRPPQPLPTSELQLTPSEIRQQKKLKQQQIKEDKQRVSETDHIFTFIISARV